MKLDKLAELTAAVLSSLPADALAARLALSVLADELLGLELDRATREHWSARAIPATRFDAYVQAQESNEQQRRDEDDGRAEEPSIGAGYNPDRSR